MPAKGLKSLGFVGLERGKFFPFQSVPTFQSRMWPAQPRKALGAEPLFVYPLSGRTVHSHIPAGLPARIMWVNRYRSASQTAKNWGNSWQRLLSFLKKERREAEVRIVLSPQKNNINILADTAEGGFIYELKRINGVRWCLAPQPAGENPGKPAF